MRFCAIGAGAMGSPYGGGLAVTGHDVTLIDTRAIRRPANCRIICWLKSSRSCAKARRLVFPPPWHHAVT